MIVEPSTQNQKTMRSDAGLSEQPNEHGEQTVQAQGLNDNSVIDDLINNSAEEDHQSTATSTPITHHALKLQATRDKNVQPDEPSPNQDAPGSRRQKEHDQPKTNERPETDHSEFWSSSSETGEIPDDSIFTTDDESTVTGKKRQHSPDSAIDKNQKPRITGETLDCTCGSAVTLPRTAGFSCLCICGRVYAKCACENVVSTLGDLPANCDKCRKPVARRHLDVTM